jgi:release factor glutamine methyltransferase
MNENLPPKTPAINDWLLSATRQLVGAGIGSAKLDAEIILAHTLRKGRTYLHAHGDELLTDRQREIANARLNLRLDRTPIAYIIGHKEFYGHLFQVTPATLIPRPESEVMIDILIELNAQLSLLPTTQRRLVDVGTGSGCIGISAKLALPELDVTLLDVSRHALAVATKNAASLKADVHAYVSNLLAQYPFKADFILANLPYVDNAWERSPETRYEPSLALFADHAGLALINQLIDQTDDHLQPGGHLLLEADPRQHDTIIAKARTRSLQLVARRGFIVAFVYSRS